MNKLFLLSFCLILALNVEALSNIEGTKQGISSGHHIQGSSAIGGGSLGHRIVRSPQFSFHHRSFHSSGGGLEGLNHGGQFGVRGQGGRIVREIGKEGLTKEEIAVGSQRLTREPIEHKKQQIEGENPLNGRVSREPFQRDLHQQGLVGGQQSMGLHGNGRVLRETVNFVPKTAIDSQGVVQSSHRISRDQGGHGNGFVGRQFAAGTDGIEGQNIEHKGTRITRNQQQMEEEKPKGNVRMSGENLEMTKKVEKREISKTMPTEEKQRWTRCNPLNQSIFDLTLNSLDGQPIGLDKFKGKMLLVVNVATFCAYTEHYLDFGPLLDKFLDLRILAFPCNQFGLQEPAENHEIMNGIRYVRPGNNFELPQNVQMFGKMDVNGEGQSELFGRLKGACPPTVLDIGKREQMFWNPIKVNDVTWNFEKFLIDQNGMPRFRFHPTAWEKGKLMEQFLEELAGGQKVQLEGSRIGQGQMANEVGPKSSEEEKD